MTFHPSCLSGTGSSSFYSVAMVAVPDCVDSGTQTDITFQNIVAVGKSRGRHQHQHQHRGPSPSPAPPSPPPPHLMAPNGLDELYVLTRVGWWGGGTPQSGLTVTSCLSVRSCVFEDDDDVDVSNQEVDRQEDLEYEVTPCPSVKRPCLCVCWSPEARTGLKLSSLSPTRRWSSTSPASRRSWA